MSHPIAEIFSQGEEVISGQIADTNAAWLSQQLVEMGFSIARHTAVGDKLQDLVDLLKEISHRADFCICTGGLGPTIDDLTAEAVATAFDSPLQLDTEALQQIEHYFANRNKEMAEINRKQALFPKKAVRIDNAWGTAPGFAIQQNRCWFVFVPGVPTEMRNMFSAHIKAALQKRFVLQADKLYSIKSVGIGESDLQQKLNDYQLPDSVHLSFRATTDEVQTKLLFAANTAETEIKTTLDQVLALIGDPVFVCEQPGQASMDLISVIDQLMSEKQMTLSVLETASQGLISAKCIAQDWLLDASYKQSIGCLMTQLGLPMQGDLRQMASAIATKLKQQNNSDLVLVQLYQGDKKQFEQKEKSIVIYNVLLTAEGLVQNSHTLAGPIKRKQTQAAIRGLDLLRRFLQNKCH